MIGTTINGQYTIVRRLGGGGMGTVYEAEDHHSGRHVAIKVIQSGDLTRDKALVGRFHREIKAILSIATDHIVQVFDTGVDATTGTPFMVMEHLMGEDLSQIFKRVGPLTPEVALKIAAQACLGLEAAHSAHIVHRDIKPANLFLAQQADGALRVKLLDFGVAKIKMDQANVTDTTGLTRTGSMIGSPLYMSPEQARGSKSIDHRADLWSLGVVLYQALAGRTPNQEIDALGELIIAICSEPPLSVQEYAPWVRPEVAAIVDRALRLHPGERFQTAGEMRAAIEPLLSGGMALTPAMLAPAPPELRGQVAARFVAPPSMAPPGRWASSSGSGMRRVEPPLALTPPEAAPAPSMVPAGTNEGVARSPTPGPTGGLRAPVIVGVAVLLGAGLGVGLYQVTSPATAQPMETAQTPPPPPTPSAAPTPSAVPTPSAAPTQAPIAAPAQPSRTVKVAIVPSWAEVEVEGSKAALENGLLEITGGLGTVHRVRVFKGALEIVKDVVLTENGPMPPAITLPKTPPPAAPTAAPAAAPTAAPTAAPKPTQTTRPPETKFKEKFE